MIKAFIKTPAFITTNIWRKREKLKYSLLPLALYDKLTFEKIDERKIHIRKESGFKIPTNDANPVYRAAILLQNRKPNKLGAIIRIRKNIPSFSGLSSQAGNAAGALIALNRLWNFNLNEKELMKIAKKISPEIAEILKTYFKPNPDRKNIVLIRPRYIKTNSDWMENKVKSGNLKQKTTYEAIAFRHFPDLKEMAGILKKAGYKKCGMSGKGPVIFGLSDKTPDVRNIKKTLTKKSDFFWFGKTCNKWGKLLM